MPCKAQRHLQIITIKILRSLRASQSLTTRGLFWRRMLIWLALANWKWRVNSKTRVLCLYQCKILFTKVLLTCSNTDWTSRRTWCRSWLRVWALVVTAPVPEELFLNRIDKALVWAIVLCQTETMKIFRKLSRYLKNLQLKTSPANRRRQLREASIESSPQSTSVSTS